MEDLQEIIPDVLRSLATSNADNAQHDHERALEKAEMAAWDAYAIGWLQEMTKHVSVDPRQAFEGCADFADRMIDRRRKYFGFEMLTVAKAPAEVG